MFVLQDFLLEIWRRRGGPVMFVFLALLDFVVVFAQGGSVAGARLVVMFALLNFLVVLAQGGSVAVRGSS